MGADTGASLDAVLVGVSRGVVAAQRRLDDHTIERIEGWDETGIPPTGFAWSGLSVALPVRLRMDGVGRPRLQLSVAEESSAHLRVRIGYVALDPDDAPPAVVATDREAGARTAEGVATCAS